MKRSKLVLLVMLEISLAFTAAGSALLAEDTLQTAAKGIRILPGQWRPHYPWEHIAWVSPPWPSQDYFWLDLPEAVFAESDLLFLSHINPPFPARYTNLPKVQWKTIPGGIAFERVLPNGVKFGASVTKNADSTGCSLQIFIENGSSEPLKDIKLQTCAYLRAIKEFSDFTAENKFVHLPDAGWKTFDEALVSAKKARPSGSRKGRCRLGWRAGPAAADLPVMVTLSNKAERLVAFTWYENTYSLICNPDHPCFHADPFFPDIQPGRRAEIHGELLFFEGSLDRFTDFFEKRLHTVKKTPN